MNILISSLKEAACYFLATLMGQNPSYEQVNRALINMPNVRPLNIYPRPNFGKSGVAVEKRRAAKRRRKAK
nr:hypothetical protein [uncultured Neisseria sp.]